MNFRCRAMLVYAYDNISPAQCFPWMFHQAHLGTASARVLLFCSTPFVLFQETQQLHLGVLRPQRLCG